MSENLSEVKTYLVTYTCDVCGHGEMTPTGAMLMSNPPKFPHRCSNCGATGIFEKQYPCVEYGTWGKK